MQPQDLPSHLQHSFNRFKLPRQNRFQRPQHRAGWLGRLSPQVSVSNKIWWGYAIALGIAVLGTTAGLTIGNYFQSEARSRLAEAQNQWKLLTRLQLSLVEFRPVREFVPVIRDENRFEMAEQDFAMRVAQVEFLLSELQSSASGQYQSETGPFLTSFEQALVDYTASLNLLLNAVEPDELSAEDFLAVQQRLAQYEEGPEFLKLFRFSQELESLLVIAEVRDTTAQTALDRAEDIRTLIIVGSMVLSIAIAILLAVYTGHAIARPIESVTQVAHRVAKEADFNLQAPITTQDEVGLLAASLNQLIDWMAAYTKELQDTQTQLIQTEKMSSLGQMVAGVAHEINNPVNFIYGNLNYAKLYTQDLLQLVELYRSHYPSPPPEIQARIEAIDLNFLQEDMPKLLESMKLGTERIRDIVLSLRNFSRLDEAEMKRIDLHEGIDDTLLLLSNRLKQGIEIEKEYGNLPPVDCYPAQINQVFMNILNNAIDALLERQDQAHKLIRVTTQTAAQQVWVRIYDNGGGIPPAIKSKLFDPFFTTKPIGQGTGLGLAICYQIVEKHHGKIEVHSQLGEGTEFAIALPLR